MKVAIERRQFYIPMNNLAHNSRLQYSLPAEVKTAFVAVHFPSANLVQTYSLQATPLDINHPHSSLHQPLHILRTR